MGCGNCKATNADKTLLKQEREKTPSKNRSDLVGVDREAALQRLFGDLDKNCDGKIVAAEYLEFLKEALGSSNCTLDQAALTMSFKDTDRDGTLSQVEVSKSCEGVDVATIVQWCEKLERTAALKRLFTALDTNHDGKIVAAEYLSFLKDALGTKASLEQAQKSLAFKDGDKNGTLSEAEIAASCESVDVAMIIDWCEKLEVASPSATMSI